MRVAASEPYRQGKGLELPAVFSLIGHTPLVRLQPFEPSPRVEVYAKLEGQNPGGSVKDRAASRMLLAGLESGKLVPGRIIMDATSGNTGIAYAMLGAALGFRVRLCVPANVTPERLQTLRAFGAEVVLTDALSGSDGAIREARRLAEEAPDQYFYPDQYSNPANPLAHDESTAMEILQQTHGRLTHFVAGLGTSGTFIGTGRRLRASQPGVRLISAQPDSPLHAIEGWKHMESALVPAIYDPMLADEDIPVSTEEAWEMTRQLARRAGLLLGVSSGASLAAALHVARRLDSGVVVTVFPDGGNRYLSERHWHEVDEQ